jgi:hypothetical protein
MLWPVGNLDQIEHDYDNDVAKAGALNVCSMQRNPTRSWQTFTGCRHGLVRPTRGMRVRTEWGHGSWTDQ